MRLAISGMFWKYIRGRFDSRVHCTWRDLMLWTRPVRPGDVTYWVN